MKTAREIIMESNEGYSFYDVICNLTEDQILECMEEHAEQYKKENDILRAELAEQRYLASLRSKEIVMGIKELGLKW